MADETSLDPANWDEFRAVAHRMLDVAIDHMEGVADRPVWTQITEDAKASLSQDLPMTPQPIEQVCDEFIANVLPFQNGNTHPRFFGWVHGAGTPGAVIAESFAAAMNANLGGRDHGAIYVERQIIDWCRTLFGFPDTASGLVVSGTSLATMIALTTARNDKAENDVRLEGVSGARLVGYTSVEAHSCVARAFDHMGLGQNNLRHVAVDRDFRMDIADLRRAIEEDIAQGNLPFCVTGSAATVNSGAMDDLDAIADICAEFNLWFHVDGAFGAVAALSERLKPRLKGLERADSIAFDFHKWMHVQYDAGFVLIRREDLHREAFSLRREYLAPATRGLAAGNPWFCEYGPELSRGFRALKIWFALKEHGVVKIARKIEDNCDQAAYLGRLVEDHADLELVAPVSLNIVCFRFVTPGASEDDLKTLNSEIVTRIQESGVAAPSTTILRGKYAIRVNITNHRTRMSDMDVLVDAVIATGRDLKG